MHLHYKITRGNRGNHPILVALSGVFTFRFTLLGAFTTCIPETEAHK